MDVKVIHILFSPESREITIFDVRELNLIDRLNGKIILLLNDLNNEHEDKNRNIVRDLEWIGIKIYKTIYLSSYLNKIKEIVSELINNKILRYSEDGKKLIDSSDSNNVVMLNINNNWIPLYDYYCLFVQYLEKINYKFIYKDVNYFNLLNKSNFIRYKKIKLLGRSIYNIYQLRRNGFKADVIRKFIGESEEFANYKLLVSMQIKELKTNKILYMQTIEKIFKLSFISGHPTDIESSGYIVGDKYVHSENKIKMKDYIHIEYSDYLKCKEHGCIQKLKFLFNVENIGYSIKYGNVTELLIAYKSQNNTSSGINWIINPISINIKNHGQKSTVFADKSILDIKPETILYLDKIGYVIVDSNSTKNEFTVNFIDL